MKKLYDKDETLFAILWIVIYCGIMTPLKGGQEYGSGLGTLLLLAIAAGITFFVKNYHLEEKYGLTGWPENSKRFLCFLPMLVFALMNLTGGVALNYHGVSLAFAVVSMMLVGYIEEMIFRGFLFKGLLKEGGTKKAIIIASVTFGVGHIINLFAGQATLTTLAQICYAIAFGFVVTLVFYKSGSLIPSILVHGLTDVIALFGTENTSELIYWIAVGTVIVIGVIYSIYLAKLPSTEGNLEEEVRS